MTALPPQPNCLLCDRAVNLLQSHFLATGDFLPTDDPLTAFCDAPLHWPCYAKWKERPRFAAHFVDAWVKANRKNPFWWCVHNDEQIYIAINPQKPIEEASIRLRAVGSDIRVPLPRWVDWLANVQKLTPELQDLERDELKRVLPALRERFPDDHALVDAIDPDEKKPRGKKK